MLAEKQCDREAEDDDSEEELFVVDQSGHVESIHGFRYYLK